MHNRTYFLATSMFVTYTFLAMATPGRASFDSDELKCRKAISKSVGKVVKTAAKVAAGCHKDRNRNRRSESDNCNDLSVADTRQKLASAQLKAAAAIGKSCPATIGTDLLDRYVSCPEPCRTATGADNPLADYDQLAACLVCVAGDEIAARNLVILGSPAAPLDDPDTGDDEQRCHATVAKTYDKLLQTALKEQSKCLANAEKRGTACGLDETGCADLDPSGKIAKAAAKTVAQVSDVCTGVDLTELGLTGACSSATDPSDLNNCSLAETESTGDSLLLAIDGLGADGICPSAVVLTFAAGFGADCESDNDCPGAATCGLSGQCETSSGIDIGWNGEAHDLEITAGYDLSLDFDCGPSTPDTCDDCTVTGMTTTGGAPVGVSRCDFDPSVECSDPFDLTPGIDPACDDASAGSCRLYLSPPRPAAASLTPTCTLTWHATDVSGNANADTGEYALATDLRSKVHTGISQTQPCPVCQNDSTIADGIAAGTCVGGSRDGLSCDTQALHATFASADSGLGLSIDCPPDPLSNISGAGTVVRIDWTTETSSLPFETSCDAPLGSLDCACAVCSSATDVPCANDDDCGPGEGTCIGSFGAARRPNACSDLTCTDVGGGRGQCLGGGAGDTLRFCDGVVRANGDGYLSCDNNVDCAALDPTCPGGDCGDCSVSKTRPCFVDPIVAQGSSDAETPLLAGTYCMAQTSGSGTNAARGLPGAARTILQSSVTPVY